MKRMPSVDHIHRELMRKGVSKKLLWTKYLEECCLCNESPLMYSQFCYYIQQDEQKRRTSMHIPRKPAEQVEADGAGDPAKIIDPDTGELFLGDIVISLDKVKEQAEKYNHSVRREFAFLVAHSMLHLLGYDHMTPEEAKDMESRQSAALEHLGITRD